MATNTIDSLALHTVDQCLVLTLPGRLDYLSCEGVQNLVLAQISQHMPLGLIIDFSMNNILDSTTMLCLIRLARASRLLGSPCVFIGLNAALVFALMDYQLDTHDLTFNTDLQGALTHFTQVDGFEDEQSHDAEADFELSNGTEYDTEHEPEQHIGFEPENGGELELKQSLVDKYTEFENKIADTLNFKNDYRHEIDNES